MNAKTIIVNYGYEGENSRNANAICLHNIISNIKNKEDFLIITSNAREVKEMLIDGVKVINLKGYHNFLIPTTNSEKRKTLNRFKRDAISEITMILKELHVNNILCISFPFITLEVGYEIKQAYPFINFLIYELDPYALNSALRFPKSLYNYRRYKESKVFTLATKILLTNELYDSYKSTYYKKYKSKFIRLGIPMLNILNDENIIKSNNECRIVYAGALSRNFRNPTFMLSVFESIKTKGNWTLHIYGADRSTIDEYFIDALGDRLQLHNRVLKSEMSEILKEASILLNISNVMNNQLPSKVLEYIGLRKPIINFYSNDNDISNKYLNKYPLKLLIRETNGNEEQISNNLLSFISENYNSYCSVDEVLDIYNDMTTKSIANRLNNLLNK